MDPGVGGWATKPWWVKLWAAALVLAVLVGLIVVTQSALAAVGVVVAVLLITLVRRPGQPREELDGPAADIRAIRNILSVFLFLVLFGLVWWGISSIETPEEQQDRVVCEFTGNC